MDIDSVFIECLKLPVFARMEYLESEQIKSKFQKETFLKILFYKWGKYKSIVFKEDLEKPFDDLVKEKGWEFAAITVYGDEPEPFEHIYSEIELNEIDAENIFKNKRQNNFDWLDEKVLWLIKDYIYKLYEKWDSEAFEGLEMRKVTNPPQQTETKTDKFKVKLSKYGFCELSKVKQLSVPNKHSLIELMNKNGLPYSIAMFDYLEFLKHLEKEHFKTKDKLTKEVAKWFNRGKNKRAVKGNINILSEHSTDNKNRYTAYQHKETVKKDYQKLK